MKKIAIVIPCYQESRSIKKNVEIVKTYLKSKNSYIFDVVLVNDGSKDNTLEIINSIDGIRIVTYDVNQGKGHAVKDGLKYAVDVSNSDYYIFMDADLSTHLPAIDECLPILESGVDLVLASRYDKESRVPIKQPLKRRFISKCARILIKMMFNFKGIKDTQCGFKSMNKDTVKLIISKAKMERFSFDVEYIYIAILNKLSMTELGITWSDDRGSTVSPFKSSIKFFKDLGFIKRHRKQYYFNPEDAKNYHPVWPSVLAVFLLVVTIVALVLFLIFKQK